MEALSKKRVAKVRSIPFFLAHVVALSAVLLPFSWKYVALAVGLYVVRMFGLTAGFHRYFAHRTFKTSRPVQFLLALLGGMSAQKGALWWAGLHRDHHKHSDEEGDIHSPVREGFWWSHVGWVLSTRHDDTPFDRIRDFAKYPELRWLNRYHYLPPAALAVTLALVGGWPALVWGFFVSTVLLWHGTFTVNSLNHMFGSRRFETTDDSRNNPLLAFITLGEGWHNNHHHYQASTNQGFYWWEYDFTYYALKAFSWVGLVWDLRTPPERVLEQGRKRATKGAKGTSIAMPVPVPGGE